MDTVSGGGVLVGGEPAALLAASSALHEMATRTDDVGRQMAAALGPVATTVLATAPFAPLRTGAVLEALAMVTSSPHAGLLTVGAAYEALSTQLRVSGQALEAAGAVGLLASGGLGLLRGERPTVLASAEGVDLRREVVTGTWSVGDLAQSSAMGVREVRGPSGTSFFVVEMTVASGYAPGLGVQVNGVGGYVEGAEGGELTLRWAAPTRRDAELLLAAATLSLAARGLGPRLPKPTEVALAVVGSVTAVGGVAFVPGSAVAGGTTVRRDVTFLGSGGQRFTTSVGGGGQLSLAGVTGTGGSAAVTVAVHRSPAGVIDRVRVTTTTQADRGRHGQPLLESVNREATQVEREVEVELTPERRAAAERIAAALARGEEPDPADVRAVVSGPGIEVSARTYDVRHQGVSADVSLPQRIGGGGGGSVATAELREP